jgi:replicative DNA helicase
MIPPSLNFENAPATSLKEAPYNIEAEQALLGAVLVNNKIFERISDILKAEYFYEGAHARIFTAIVTLLERGQIANTITLKSFFEQDAMLTSIGGAGYLADLAAGALSAIGVEDYARLIHDLYLRRQLMELGQNLTQDAVSQALEASARDLIEGAEKQLYELATVGDYRGGFSAFRQSLKLALEMAEAAYKRDSHITGVTSGLSDIDHKLGGLHPSDLLILAGRPSMGKTALATNIAYHAARAYQESAGKDGAVVGFFSLEMSAEQLATRILADVATIPSENIRRGDLLPAHWQSFVQNASMLERLPLYIDDTPALSISAVRTRARRLQRQYGLGLLVIDYLQLLSGSAGARSESRVLEVSEITRGLKAIAKELHIPVLALSQLSRQVESREDKRPQLADLRESGSIEQDADVVMFVFREQYYLERAEPGRRDGEEDSKYQERYQKWQQRLTEVHNIAELIVAKQRHGPVGTVKLFFDGQYTRFGNLDAHHSSPPT